MANEVSTRWRSSLVGIVERDDRVVLDLAPQRAEPGAHIGVGQQLVLQLLTLGQQFGIGAQSLGEGDDAGIDGVAHVVVRSRSRHRRGSGARRRRSWRRSCRRSTRVSTTATRARVADRNVALLSSRKPPRPVSTASSSRCWWPPSTARSMALPTRGATGVARTRRSTNVSSAEAHVASSSTSNAPRSRSLTACAGLAGVAVRRPSSRPVAGRRGRPPVARPAPRGSRSWSARIRRATGRSDPCDWG